jgi:hypothetical protein
MTLSAPNPRKRHNERSVMNDLAQKAIEVLVEIAENKEAKPSDETRIHAACAILDRLDKVPEGSPVAA